MQNTKYNPVGWFEIYVQDMERAKKFYEAVFQVELTDMSPPDEDWDEMKMLGFPMQEQGEAPGASGALVKMQGVQSGGNSTIVYFSSADCAIEEARVEAAGGKVFKPKTSIGEHGFMTLLFDVDNNLVGLHSMK